MKELINKLLQGEHSLFRLSLPFRVRLFNVLALTGGVISLVNGISSYINNQDLIILELTQELRYYHFCYYFMPIKVEITSFAMLSRSS